MQHSRATLRIATAWWAFCTGLWPVPGQTSGWLDQARQAQQAGNYVRAAELYSRAAARMPGDAQLLSNAGIMWHLAGREQTALQTFQKALRLNPSLVPPNLFSGLALLSMNRAREALPYLERARRGEDSYLTNLSLAKAYAAVREFRRANDFYFAASRRDGTQPEGWYGLGVTYRNLLNAAALRIGSMAPDSPGIKERLVDFAIVADRHAMELREAEVAAHPHDLDALIRLAQCYETLALDAFNRAVELDPRASRAHLAVAESYAEQGRLDAAVPEYLAAIRTAPDSAAAYLGLATAFWRADDRERALAPLRKALALAPADPEANAVMADLLERQGAYDQAAACARRALAANPDLLVARRALGKSLLAQGQPEQAVAVLQRGLEWDSDGTSHYVLASALRSLGRQQEAREALRVYRARHRIFRKDAVEVAEP